MRNTFTFHPSDDPSVDPEYVLDQDPRWTIQDSRAWGAGLAVVEHADESEPDFWICHHSEHEDLEMAKADLISRAGRNAPQ